ncbi:MAG: type VI secretion system baseplate subunit TssE [Acidobacteriia bacterium]|nr:type VI secretion system baseplate subunit TssE [Terriglobia bacterium]
MTPRDEVAPFQSLLDHLTDLEPDRRAEAPPSPWELRREMKAALCRDLTDLLNVRRADEPVDPVYKESAESILSFGVADFTSYNLKNGIEQERVRRSIEQAIRRFEPRLSGVTVSLEPPDPLQPVLRFQISALLRIDPGAGPVIFDAALHRDSRRLAVAGDGL